jgi:hypothetical protein
MAHTLSGLVLVGCVVFTILSLRGMNSYQTLVLALLFAIAIGVHGLSHAILEKEYNYVPFYFLNPA